jgi:hypothetical protein
MLASVRYEKGHGNTSIFARARNQSGQVYNFITTTWVGTEGSATKVFLTEYADGDPIDSLYSADVAFPNLESIQEVVDSSSSLVIGSGVYSPVSASGLTLAEIESSLVLAKESSVNLAVKSNDTRLDNLDAKISLTATYSQVDSIFIPLLDALVAIQDNTGNINTDLTDIADAHLGNWEIAGTQMIFYRRNGVELMRFNLTDKFGNPSDHNVFKRVKA